MPGSHHIDSTSSFKLIVGDSRLPDWVNRHPETISKNFRKYGALLFRGFSGGLDDFVAFTDTFCDSYMFNTVPLRRMRLVVSRQHKVQTVNRGGQFFPLHAERAQTPFQADIAFFHCRQAPLTGGATTFCDGALLVSNFSDALRKYLSGKIFRYLTSPSIEEMLNFLDISNPKLLEKTLKMRSLDKVYYFNNGNLLMNYMVPALRESKFNKDLAFAHFLLFSRYGLNRDDFPIFAGGSKIPQSVCDEIHEIARQLTTNVEWQDNDYLMLDNTRVMHGRNAFSPDVTREIWSRFGYARSEWLL